MCGTCGCGTENNGPTISKPGEENHHHHNGHSHDEQHHHGGHSHDQHHHHHNDSHSHSHDHDHKHKVLEIEQDILQNNQLLAARNRGYFEAKNIFALNLVSSPGSGKTTLLERTLADLKTEIPFYVVEGDQQTLNDANRIAALDVPVIQINTGKGCHLESDMVYEAVKKLNLKDNSVLMIENVGNLVCPSMFDLGENKRVVIISTTEGEDKPIKYPDMFFTSDICIINKIDLLPYVNINVESIKKYALQVNPKLLFFEVSATTGEGMEAWYAWLKENIV
ncbi:hydrogenase nickel incorporation protein HypB [Lutibacter sp.]|uniref:hydrogenase nickel incorporation protein HypB n=1 Tax=Lutibacter sp. TaxID=1925666 RepID=UPI003568F60A